MGGTNRLVLAILVMAMACNVARAEDPLPSWNDGPAKKAIVGFVSKVTSEDGGNFIPPAMRIDDEREFAYDRQSHIGKLDKALDEANSRGWTVVDMKRDWKVMFQP
jgi:hypothetical protein